MRKFMLWTLAVAAVLVWLAPVACLIGGIWLPSWQWALTTIPAVLVASIWSALAIILAAKIDEHFDYAEGRTARTETRVNVRLTAVDNFSPKLRRIADKWAESGE